MVRKKRRWENDTVVITGGCGNIGRALCDEFIKRGARVFLLDIECGHKEYKQFFVQCDLSQSDQINDALDRIGDITILINNCGVFNSGKSFMDLPGNLFDRTMNINFTSYTRTIRKVLPNMIKNTNVDCAIVNMASCLGIAGTPFVTDYCASKFAVYGFNEALRMELKTMNIKNVKTLIACPFFVKNGLFPSIKIRFPWLTTTLNSAQIVECVLNGIENNCEEYQHGYLIRPSFFSELTRAYNKPITPPVTVRKIMETVDGDLMMGHFVTPGEVITEDPAFMRGHGTYRQNGCLRAAVAGVVERTNMLISVLPLKSRYLGDIGDVVIGRITVVGNKRWKVEANARQDSVLHLSSIYLPGGIQRRKSEEDELQMRTFFAEGEIICAEVQSLYSDGAIGIHTRNLRYGKLVTGELLRVQSSLVKRQKSHFLIIPGLQVEVILGMNGLIWVGKPRRPAANQEDLDAMYSATLDLVTPEERRNIIMVRNAIKELDANFNYIDEPSILLTLKSMNNK